MHALRAGRSLPTVQGSYSLIHTRTCRTAAVPVVVVAVVALLHARPHPVSTLAGRADRALRNTTRRARPTALDRGQHGKQNIRP